MLRAIIFTGLLLIQVPILWGQQAVSLKVLDENNQPLPYANVFLEKSKTGTTTDENGQFSLTLPQDKENIIVSFVGYQNLVIASNELSGKQSLSLTPKALGEVVVTGTMKEISRLESPVPVEVFSPTFFKKNPTPSIFEALQNVNGVRPQLNCNVCNTGDIHINGLEGPYTMVLIDGMPIVSGLSTVYGLSGIPNAMIERVEIVKGPASSLYGSEAVGGLINIITKHPEYAPVIATDLMLSGWGEANVDVGLKQRVGKKSSVLTGLNYFNYSNPIDNNQDGFTDVTLQDRISVFQKWNFHRDNNRVFTLAGRYFYEDRWGGEMNWTPEFRGGDSIYGESIYTNRAEIIGKYQLPTTENLMLQFSVNHHNQNSYYGDMGYMAKQNIGFGQLTWSKTLAHHDLLLGAAYRHTLYDDNTTATANKGDVTSLPGLFVQDEIKLSEKQTVLLGGRYDYHSAHGGIFTPRLAYKYMFSDKSVLRLNGGTGFRVVNLFTEEHAALTGSRVVEVTEDLLPERSYNVNLNYVNKFYSVGGNSFGIDLSAWYSHFNNQILPDYDTDPNKIIYDNLKGNASTQGITLNTETKLANGLKIIAGATVMNVSVTEANDEGVNETYRPVLTENWTGTFSVSYRLKKLHTTIDYTGNIYGPMRLPLLGNLDPRDEYSPVWSLQNIQLTYAKENGKWEVYGGVKNLLNFTPPANSIARSHDPFDRNVTFDRNGEVVASPNNPYALTFDPSYVYAPNQGRRLFVGVRYTLR